MIENPKLDKKLKKQLNKFFDRFKIPVTPQNISLFFRVEKGKHISDKEAEDIYEKYSEYLREKEKEKIHTSKVFERKQPTFTTAEVYRGKECALLKEANVYVSPSIITEAILISEQMGNIEWLGYLVGEKKDNNFFCKALKIPRQKVSYTSASVISGHERLEYPEGKVIGTIHSHHTMHIGASSVDEYTPHPVLIIIRKKREGDKFIFGDYSFLCYVSLPLPCKDFAYIMFETDFILGTPEEEEKISKKIKDAIEKESLGYYGKLPTYYQKKEEKEKEKENKEWGFGYPYEIW
ncbi:MAG: hypothetical protein QXO40_00050 [Candidatus Aenigmatarchaeota archaeon]